MLCVSILKGEDDPKDVVIRAIRRIFIEEKTLKPCDVPVRIMIAEELPRNGNGKIDLYKINRGEVEGDVYSTEAVHRHGELTDFKLVPYEEGPADMIKEVFDGITAEIKGNLPFNKNNLKEDNKMNPKKAFEDWNAMNSMGRQMMQNMMSQMCPGKDFEQCKGMPDMSKMMPFMSNMSKMMPFMSDMSKMMPFMPDMSKMMQNQTQTALLAMQQQMNQLVTYMSQMNQITLEMMQKMFDQHCSMMNQFFDMAEKQISGEMPATAADPATEPEKAADEPAKETKTPVKTAKASAKTTKTSAKTTKTSARTTKAPAKTAKADK
jgi:hypothetical protein